MQSFFLSNFLSAFLSVFLCVDTFIAACLHHLCAVSSHIFCTNVIIYFFLHARGGEIHPTSACSSFAAKNKGMDQKSEDGIQFLPSEDVNCTMGGPNICSGNQKNSPEPETPEKKRAKRGGDEEAEEGEIVDSSDEEDEGITVEKAACEVNSANHTEGIEEEAADGESWQQQAN